MNLKREIRLGRKSGSKARAAKQSGPHAGKKRAKKGSADFVGVKLGATQIAAAHVTNGKDGPKLLQVERHPLPAGIISAGEVTDVAALAAGLDEFFRTSKLPRRGVRIGIATNHVGVRTFDIAGIDDEAQLANAVLFRAHEVVSIPVDEAVIDYRVVNEERDASGVVNRRILLVAAYREPIERYASAFREAGIELSGVDLEAFALLRAVSAPAPAGEAPAAAVVSLNVGHERTILAVSDGNVCQFTRVVEWGGAKLAAAIARDLNVKAEEAGELLLQISFDREQAAPAPPAPPTAADASADQQDAEAATVNERAAVAQTLPARPVGLDVDGAASQRLATAREGALRELHVLARELVSSLQFYQGQPGALPIAEVLISGGTSRLTGFVSELERLTRVRVRPADPLARVQVEKGVGNRDDLASLAIAIGLGVED